jgi:hypothetical protein
MFLYFRESRQALGPTRLPVVTVEALYLGVNCPGREADHSPPSNAEVRSSGCIPPHSQCLHGRVLS